MSDNEPKSEMMSVKQALNLALQHCKAGEFAQAESICRQLLVQQPGNADALYFMSLIARQKGNTIRSVELVQQAIAIKPNVFIYYQSLAATLKSMGQFEKAVGIYRKALEINPNEAEIFNDLGNALMALNRWDEALGAINTAARLQPESADIQLNLGNICKDMDQLDAAASAFEKAIELKPDMAMPHNNLGNIFKSQGKAPAAIAEYRRAVELNPDLAQAYSNVIYVMHLDPAYDAAAIHEETLQWKRKYADPLKESIRVHLNDRNPDRRLRVGYVSPDFREHVVGWNVLPLIREHNHKEFEIYCYSGVERPDDTTARIRFYADRWRDIAKTEGDATAKMIYDDQIDILVDLSLHTANHRLKVFARKPAPLQATWLGYAGTTGLDTIDYRLSDPYLDPQGTDLSVYSEQTVHLSHSFWCYQPGGEMINSKPLPAHNVGHITFGCLNNFSKVTPEALDLWAQILSAVPQSRLILYSKPGSHIEYVRNRFQSAGISPQRLNIPGWRPWLGYINQYNQIDIGLDTFPCGGGITTCDSLFMGVPMVSLSGRTAVGRGGRSILSNVGLPELIAQTPEEYKKIAVELAGDTARLAELRKILRSRIQGSPLMDAKGFAQDMETAYREMWKKWCSGGDRG